MQYSEIPRTLGELRQASYNWLEHWQLRAKNVNILRIYIYAVVSFLSKVIFLFLLFSGMLMYGNGVETKEK